MQAFQEIARNWLSAIANDNVDLSFQVFDTNASHAMATIVSEQAQALSIQVFHIEFQPKLINDPLLVFHRILRWYAKHESPQLIHSLIDEYCYPALVEVLRAWYEHEPYVRQEPLLYDESGYEEIEFNRSLLKILNRLAALKPFLVLVNQIDYAPNQLIYALNRLIENHSSIRQWGVLGFVSHVRKSARIKEQDAWQDCLRRLERQGIILPMLLENVGSATFNWYRPTTIKTFEKQYRMLLSAADLFAYRDVMQMVELVRHKYNDQHNGQLLFISAYCALMSGDLDTAARDFVKVQNLLQSTENRAILTASYYWQSICYTLKSQEKLARAAQEQCEKLALEYNDRRWYVLSLFADFYIDAYIAQHRLTQASLETLKFMLTQLGYDTILALMLTQVYAHSEHLDRVSSRAYLRNCVEALRTSRHTRNQLGMSVALHAMGVVYMRIGNVKQTQKLYELSLNIRERYQRKADLVPMLNALGYFLVGQEEWQKAWSLFDRSLTLLIENRNFSEVSITLYNFVWLYAQGGNIQRALDVLNDLLELMHIRGIDSVPFRNLKDLYVLKGWLHILQHQPVQARYCLLRLNDFKELHETTFTLVLRSILSSRVAFHENEVAVAVRDAKKALKTLETSNDLDLYIDVTLRMEIARLLVELGQEEGQPIFARLRKKAHELNLNTIAQRISRASLGLSSVSDIALPEISQPYRVLMDLARKETRISALQQELAEIHQVNLLVEMSASEPDIDVFLRQVIGILDRRVPANDFGILLINHTYNEQPLDMLLTNDSTPAIQQGWRAVLEQSPTKAQQFQVDEHVCCAWPLQMGASDCSWLVVAGDEQQKSVWNDTFLRLIAQQLGLILDRRLREAYLEYRNKTDLLTGVLNRIGLFDRLKKHFAQMQRNPASPFALCYFDLDHFKYFNDTFGHELGDGVLKNLVQCVDGHLRGSDELGRVGGDEFIILLHDTGVEEARALVERLRKIIAAPDWWLPLLVGDDEQASNPIPEQEWISASFGVVVVDGWPESGLSRISLIAQGDAAMYEAKNAGKNCVVIKPYVEDHP